MRIAALLFFGLFWALTGCASSSAARARQMDAWIGAHGGLLGDPRLTRVADIARNLAETTGGPNITSCVLNSRGVTAFSWVASNRGEVFVTAGLVDAATDEELAAAIAHEMGHLIYQLEGAKSVVSLQGTGAPLTEEQRADLIGCRLLEAAGMRPAAMKSMIEKVLAAADPATNRADLRLRLGELDRYHSHGSSTGHSQDSTRLTVR